MGARASYWEAQGKRPAAVSNDSDTALHANKPAFRRRSLYACSPAWLAAQAELVCVKVDCCRRGHGALAVLDVQFMLQHLGIELEHLTVCCTASSCRCSAAAAGALTTADAAGGRGAPLV